MTTPILSQVEPPPWEDYKKTVETPGVIADVVSPLPATQTERPPWEDYAAAPVTPVVAEPQQVEPEPWKDYKTTQSRIAPSTIAGDIERTAGSAFSGLVLSGLNAVKGIADLNAKIPLPQFVRNLKEQTGSTALEGQMRQKVDSMIEEWGQYREQVQSEIRAEGGLPAIVMQNIGDSTLNTAVMLTAMGSGGYTGVWRATKEIAKVTLTESMKLAVKEAIKFGGLMAATTHGDAKARTIAGAHAAAMMLLPIPASKLPTDWMAKSANILGLNVLSAIVGDFSIQTAKDKAVANGTPDEWAKEWFAEGVPPFVINAMFGIMAKSAKRGNPDAKILTENIPEEIKPLIEGTKQLAETKPDLPPSTSPQPQTTAKAAEAPAGAFVPQEVKGGGDISEKPVVESEVKLKPEHEDPLIEAKKRKDNGASQEEVNRVALNAADGYRETNVDEMMRKQEELGRPITKEEAEVFAKKNKAYNKLIEDRLVELGVIKKPASAAPPPSSGKAAELMTPEPVRVNPAKLTREVKSDSGYVYHATSADRLDEIISSGKLIPHKPDYGTDQSAWPDRSTEKRSYFSRKADVVWQFSPEEGDPVVIRTKDTPELRTESTGDVYSRGSIKAENLEYLGDDGNWHSLVFKPTPPAEVAQGKMGAEVTPAKIAEVKTKMDKGRKELGVSMSEQKTYLLAEIDKAIADLPLDGVGAGTVKIQVPGDGTFTITQGKENLENFRKAVKSRFPSKPSEQDKPGGSITKLSQDQSADEAMKLYGDAGKAADVLERQSKNPEYTEDQRKGFDSLVSELRDRANITSVPEHQMSDRIKEIRAKVEARAYDLEQSKAMQDAKVREQKGLDAVKKHPRYAELQKALQEKEVELPKDGDLLNVKVEGRGAPAIRDLQDAIGKDIGVPRGKPVFKGDIGSFVLERYWKDVAQEYMPEEPSTQEQAAPKGGEVAKPAESEMKKGGFITTLPGTERVGDIVGSLTTRLRQDFTSSQGQDVDWNVINNANRAQNDVVNIHQGVVANSIRMVVNGLNKTFPKNTVQQEVNNVLDGVNTIADLQAKFSLSATDPLVKEMEWILNDRAVASERIAVELEKQNKFDLAEQVRDNQGSYMTRFYLKHIMGDSFEPNKVDFDIAVDSVKNDMVKQLEKLGKRASRLGRILNKAGGSVQDVTSYLEADNETAISGLTDRQKDFARLLKDRFRSMKRVVDAVTIDPTKINKGSLVEITGDANALQMAAKDTVDYMIGKDVDRGQGSSPIDVNHLARRVLTPIFRQLFQEVGTPIERMQRTAEVQGNMLVGLETVNKIYEQGVNKWWSEGLDKAKGLDVRLDGKRFGTLDGRFVSRATERLLAEGHEKVSAVMRAYFNIVGFQRVIQVGTSLPTTERNLLSGYASYAVGGGDVLIEPIFGRNASFHANLGRAIKFVSQLATTKKGTPDRGILLKELEKLAGMGLHVRESGVTRDIMVGKGNYGQSANFLERLFFPLGVLRDRIGKTYSYGDFITKYASLLTQKQLGKTDIEAAEHVRKLYQHPSSLPIGVRAISKLPFADYPTFFFDSIRIKKNQIENAIKESKTGNIAPLIGFALSNALYALTAGRVTQWVGNIFTDEVNKKINEVMPTEQLVAMKEFQPDYWQHKPMVGRYSKDATGNPIIDYVVAGNIFGFPLDDSIVGAIQNKDFMGGIEDTLENLGRTGMTWQTISKLVVGQEIGMGASYFKTKGLIDVMRSTDPEKTTKMIGLVITAALELGVPIPRRVKNNFARWKQLDAKVEAGQITPESASEQKNDMIFSEVLPIKVRTITKDIAENMIYNTLRPDFDTIKDLKITIGKTALGLAPTPDQITEANEARKNLGEVYQSLSTKFNKAELAFHGVLSEVDRINVLVNIAGREDAMLLLNNQLDILTNYQPEPKIPTHAPLPVIKDLENRFDVLKTLRDAGGNKFTENAIRSILEQSSETGNKAHFNKMDSAERTAAIALLDRTISERTVSPTIPQSNTEKVVREIISRGGEKSMKQFELRNQAGRQNFQPIGQALENNKITRSEYDLIRRESSIPPLIRELHYMDAKDAVLVWNVATPSERQTIQQFLLHKIANAENLSPERRRSLLLKISKETVEP